MADDLKIPIIVTADTAGATQAAAAIKGVGAAAGDLKKVDSAAQDIATDFARFNIEAAKFEATLKLLNFDQLQALRQVLREDITAAQALGQNVDGLKAKLALTDAASTSALEASLLNGAKAATNLKGPLNEVGKATKELGGNVAGTSQLVRGMEETFNGATMGGLRGFGYTIKGLIRSCQGLATGGLDLVTSAWRRMTIAMAANPLGAVLIVLTAVAGAAVALYNPIKKLVTGWFEMRDAGQQVEHAVADLPKTFEDIKKAGDISLEKAKTDAKETADALERVVAAATEAETRLNAIADADLKVKQAQLNLEEATALSKTQDPVERAQIKHNYSAKRDSLITDSQLSKADREQRFQKDVIASANSSIDQSRGRITAAETDFSSQKGLVTGLNDQRNALVKSGKTGTNEYVQLLDQINVETAKLAEKEKTLKEVRKDEGANIDKAQSTIQEAKTRITVATADAQVAGITKQKDTVNQSAEQIAIDEKRKQEEARKKVQGDAIKVGGNLDASAYGVAKAHPETLEAAKALHEAAQGLKQNAGDSEVAAAVKAVTDVVKQLGAPSPQSKALLDQLGLLRREIDTLKSQIKTAGKNNQ
ncbi:MAG TPA: hypothetical protein VL357_03005 [Rariglobus sp.]|jgi:hypothetical protein|nr:hypothetical protein [Rariglobus sp.]